jgi:hypothetical protein
MTMPGRWRDGGLHDFAGRVRFRRAFGYPGRIDTGERVWLTFAGVEGVAELWLNRQHLGRFDGAGGPFEIEVTPLLGERNLLLVEVEAGETGGLWGEVALEVRATAYLRAVRAWRTPGEKDLLHVEGQVVGTAERALEVYVLLDSKNVGYTLVEAAPEGGRFQVVCEGMPRQPATQLVRVELVNAATVWYFVEHLVSI